MWRILDAQGAYFEAQGAYIDLIRIGGKAKAIELWIVRKRIMNSM